MDIASGWRQMAMKMSRQAWTFLASAGSALLTIATTVRGEFSWALLWSIAAVGLWMTTRRWQRISPVPFPYAFRWFLQILPRPAHSPARLAGLLQPRHGEHLLEIGPGIGTHSLPLASALGPEGALDVFDVQREMLDAVIRRARDAGVTNISAREGDAAHLPYADEVFDGAYMVSVLGEIADDGALRELARVLKPNGRLVIGEVFVDPDFISLRRLRARAEPAGFVFTASAGSALAYLARFERATRRP